MQICPGLSDPRHPLHGTSRLFIFLSFDEVLRSPNLLFLFSFVRMYDPVAVTPFPLQTVHVVHCSIFFVPLQTAHFLSGVSADETLFVRLAENAEHATVKIAAKISMCFMRKIIPFSTAVYDGKFFFTFFNFPPCAGYHNLL